MSELVKTKVCELADLRPYQGRSAMLDGDQVALFNIPNTGVFAVQNWDPIGKAFVLSRGIVGDVKGTLCVASPLYKQHFSLETGQCIEDPSIRLKVWQVEVSEGQVLLS
ncbi:oxidoreductase [Vibrio sinaloensis DSM 21326]|uniref:Oxidoreductase n=1 Tax=Vibrio sinaloensis DSM 21326 TaxID=945550 RepID=E8M5B8_PHOS4|nr:nitrite reductase small subunit NirD [Vibrio sinaloensis]EGA70711.1 oxidoreductase [Vibrio sinaloensis DSM 21326]